MTLIEVLMVMSVLALLSSIAVPKYREVKRRALAAQMLGDFQAVRHAVLSFHADSGYYPPEQGAGAVPRNLAPYLPIGFRMSRPSWTLDYENWSTKTRRRYRQLGIAIGVSFRVDDRQLGEAAMRLSGSMPAFTVGNRYTMLIAGY